MKERKRAKVKPSCGRSSRETSSWQNTLTRSNDKVPGVSQPLLVINLTQPHPTVILARFPTHIYWLFPLLTFGSLPEFMTSPLQRFFRSFTRCTSAFIRHSTKWRTPKTRCPYIFVTNCAPTIIMNLDHSQWSVGYTLFKST